MEGGPPCFTRDSTSLVLLWDTSQLPYWHELSWSKPPEPHWASARLQRPSSSLLGADPQVAHRAPLVGFLPRSATSSGEPGLPELTSLSTFPSRAFSAPQGLSSLRTLRPYFMPQPLLGFSPSEFFPHVTARQPFPVRFPLVLARQRWVWRGSFRLRPAPLGAFSYPPSHDGNACRTTLLVSSPPPHCSTRHGCSGPESSHRERARGGVEHPLLLSRRRRALRSRVSADVTGYLMGPADPKIVPACRLPGVAKQVRSSARPRLLLSGSER